jgi:NAD(P)-dependent dehydrogenase (short-subunit alcohol dehydrogenase family)
MNETPGGGAEAPRVALVTGAARGIGRAIAAALAREGYRLALVDRDGPALARTSEGLRAGADRDALELVGDLSDWNAPPAWIGRIEREYGRLDILVNNAGLFEYGLDFTDISEAQFDRMQAVNVKGLFRITQCATRSMLERGGGCVVSLASAAALAGSGMKAAHYAASKGAVVSLTRSLAREFGGRGIRANVVSPGAVDTDMTRAFGEAERSVYANSNPLGRMAAPEEIAEVVAFLASERSSFVNGQVISVCGGAITY